MNKKVLKKALLIYLFVKVLYPDGVHAYVDPGSGSFLAQVLLGLVISVPIFFKDRLRKLIKIFHNKKKKNPSKDVGK